MTAFRHHALAILLAAALILPTVAQAQTPPASPPAPSQPARPRAPPPKPQPPATTAPAPNPAPAGPEIDAAFVYGSIAKGSDTTRSDIDLMVVSDTVSYASVFAALGKVSKGLGREVNPTIHTLAELEQGLRSKNAFFTRVMARPKLWILGSEHGLTA